MKRKILLVVAALMMFMGVVSASSINGDYKGNPIVKIMSNGVQLETDEVPGIILDGHTMVPISTIRQLGASVTWDAYSYSVDVKMPQPAQANTSVDLLKLRNDLINEVGEVSYSIDGSGVSKLTFNLKFNANQGTDDKFNRVILIGTATGVDKLTLIDERQDGSIYSYLTVNIKDLDAQKISLEEFRNKIEITPKIRPQQDMAQPVQPAQVPQPVVQPQTQPSNNNGSNAQNGTSADFQFIGVNSFLDNFGALHITGQIKNISGKTIIGGGQLAVTLFDKDDRVVGTRGSTATGAATLNNGESASFDIIFFPVPTFTRYEINVR